MKNRKQTGSFYTPPQIAKFLVDYVFAKTKKGTAASVLEPSAGDGVFIKTIYERIPANRLSAVVAVEKKKRELDKIKKVIANKKFVPIQSDFLEYDGGKNKTFSVVIGNPPYIKKSLLNKKQIKRCKEIHRSAGLSDNSPKNVWAAFLVRCIQLTDKNGVLAFVLPAEFLQVKFADELRSLVSREFERVEIFTFGQLLFPDCQGQDTIFLICERKSKYKGVFYCNVPNTEALLRRDFSLIENVSIKESKWNHHLLDSEDIALLEKLRATLMTVNDYCTSKPGIVTAANDYFIVNEDIVKNYRLTRFVEPIIQKGLYVNGSVVFNNRDFNKLVNESKPTYFLRLDEKTIFDSNHPINEYLFWGRKLELNERYKMLKRKKWYYVPNIVPAGDGFFFKRCNEYPKLLKNYAGVLATDSAYVVEMKERRRIESLIFSFYNSLTLAYSEFYGRFYGGGVLELTPSEFKKLPVPYTDITDKDFTAYTKLFEDKSSITDVCSTYDRKIIKSANPGIDDDTISKIARILEKMSSCRLTSKNPKYNNSVSL